MVNKHYSHSECLKSRLVPSQTFVISHSCKTFITSHAVIMIKKGSKDLNNGSFVFYNYSE